MRHDITDSAAGITLRPVRLEDAADIVVLRSGPVQARFVHSISPLVEDQERWLTRYFERAGDYYFVVERSHDQRFEGTVGLYDLADGRAEWGRWVLIPGSLAAPASALLVYRIAFETLQLSEVYCRTVAENKAVLSFHDACGVRRAGVVRDAFALRDGPVDAIEHQVLAAEWPDVRAGLALQADRASRLITRDAGERAEC
ncbi:Protein N-acetyltransferase, RimJ/RimL family [Roseovarius tolerans]|uniref:Protein N-acetyltransferase, RimJ/RimL family n=1 Tax=Roseovarius tolerans TaxID=74031 RepID=A0A1H8J9S9_9RHOB|nr:GNAT family N-acetyltransferase [Roseovarius tolerans]SEN77673.1 Protein N-acetyltransferase, RimJ/RimL family [Roseovarius tolerans]